MPRKKNLSIAIRMDEKERDHFRELGKEHGGIAEFFRMTAAIYERIDPEDMATIRAYSDEFGPGLDYIIAELVSYGRPRLQRMLEKKTAKKL